MESTSLLSAATRDRRLLQANELEKVLLVEKVVGTGV